MHPPPSHSAVPDGDSAQIVNEFWDSFEALFSSHNKQRESAGKPILTWKELADKVDIKERTLSDQRNKRTLPPNSSLLVEAAVFLGGRREDWQARWRKARDAHERVTASRKRHRKPDNLASRPPAPDTGQPPSSGDELVKGGQIRAGGSSTGADWSARRAHRPPPRILTAFAVVIAAAIIAIVFANEGTGGPPAASPANRNAPTPRSTLPQVQPLRGHAKMQLLTVPVPLTTQLAETLGQSGTTSARSVTGYEFRNAGNNSAPVCLGALTTGTDAGQNHDPVRAVRCSTRARNEIWIPAQWEQGHSHQNLTWLVNDQYPSMCLNADEKSGDGSAAQLWDCYHYAYGPYGLAINEAWDFSSWYANMTSVTNPAPLFLGSGDYCLEADNQGTGPGKGNELPDGIEVDIQHYSHVAANQYWS